MEDIFSELDLSGTDLTSVHPKLLSTMIPQLKQVPLLKQPHTIRTKMLLQLHLLVYAQNDWMDILVVLIQF